MPQSVLQSVLRGFGGDTVSASVSATVSAAVWLVVHYSLVAEGCGDFRPSRAAPDIQGRNQSLSGYQAFVL